MHWHLPAEIAHAGLTDHPQPRGLASFRELRSQLRPRAALGWSLPGFSRVQLPRSRLANRGGTADPSEKRVSSLLRNGPTLLVLSVFLLLLGACAAPQPLPHRWRRLSGGSSLHSATLLSDEFDGGALDSANGTITSHLTGTASRVLFKAQRRGRGGPPATHRPGGGTRRGLGGLPQLHHGRGQEPVRYGYFEVRARPMKATISSGFWLDAITN